ncbi:Lipopolysaccharide-binding protein [Anabarilius grahami]|uniref:Bactericidal permeability-increasing protein n=1 Tax=Anabarilius grahami TaxID=495550 RepID=A0A3N0Y6W8_ANAGA|nr:Lipopolysaccharide-binding protein [Anabarilius grahami]
MQQAMAGTGDAAGHGGDWRCSRPWRGLEMQALRRLEMQARRRRLEQRARWQRLEPLEEGSSPFPHTLSKSPLTQERTQPKVERARRRLERAWSSSSSSSYWTQRRCVGPAEHRGTNHWRGMWRRTEIDELARTPVSLGGLDEMNSYYPEPLQPRTWSYLNTKNGQGDTNYEAQFLNVFVLNAGRQIGITSIQQKLRSMKVPDISGTEKVDPIGKVQYSFTGMQIVNLGLPKSALDLVPDTGVMLSIGQANINLHGNWRVKYLRIIKDSGSFDLAVGELAISTTIAVMSDDTGRPTVSMTNCAATVGSVNVKFHGGASSFINKALRSALQKQGEFYNIGQHKEPPFSPTPFSLPYQDTNMLYIGVSAFSLNSAGFVYHNAGALRLYITDDMIAKMYPGLMMKLMVETVKEPIIIFEPNNMTIQASSTVTAYAIQPNSTLSSLFVLNLEGSVSADIYVTELKLAGNLTLNNLMSYTVLLVLSCSQALAFPVPRLDACLALLCLLHQRP